MNNNLIFLSHIELYSSIMTENQEHDAKYIKVCLLGGEKVGKTYLAHKLVDQQYSEYKHEVECQKFIKNIQEKHETLVYYDFPPLNDKLIQEIMCDHKLDVMVCIFKDSTTFAQLYQFLQSISIKTEQNDESFNEYWENIKYIILVYSDYEQKGKVQIEQLFSILSEEIRNFNRSAPIKEFVLKSHLQNCQYLQKLIQKSRSAHHNNEDLTASQKESHKNQEELTRSKLEAKNKRLSYSKDASILKTRDFSKSFNVEQILDKNEENIPHEHGNIDIMEIDFANPDNKPLQVVHQASVAQKQIQQQQVREIIKAPSNENNQAQKQISQIKDEVKHHHEQANQIQKQQIKHQVINKPQTNHHNQLHQKQKEHYLQIYNRLMEKINSEQIEPSKKTSYHDLFEQFRKTSQEDSKISQQMHNYWEKKLQKLEQQDENDDQEEEPEEHINHSNVDTVRKEDPHQHTLPTHPKSNYLDGGRPKKQKKTIQSKSCECIIM